jgi:hypothetical protein
MNKKAKAFELTANIERYLAALSKLYAQDGKRELQEIVVNAQVRVHEEWTYDNWDGGVWGHALFLTVPESIFLRSVKKKDEVQNEIKEDINKIHNVRDEFIDAVFLEMDVPDDAAWRLESGLLIAGKRDVSDDAVKRIWGDGGFRVFLSHKSSVKKETAELKDQLRLFGMSAFVAHEDIHPTKAWQDEIENALASMDAFVALMTEDFHDSDWTDQEVGYALARGVPILAIRLGSDPYGFIGKFQAVSTDWNGAAVNIAKVFIKHDRAFSAYVQALHHCPNWNTANLLAEALPGLERLDDKQVDELASVYNETYELRGGWGFNGRKPGLYGPGLVHYLNLCGKRKFRLGEDRIEAIE